MARRRSNTTVSLFPFLAVLVCTMGALILLLLVTTRRIRQKQAVVEVTAPEFIPERTVLAVEQSTAMARQILEASQELFQLRQQHADLTRRLREAEQLLAADPVVQALLRDFPGARIVPGSVEPLDPSH